MGKMKKDVTSMTEEEKQRRKARIKKARKKRRRQQAMVLRVLVLFGLIVVLVSAIVGVSKKVKEAKEQREAEKAYQEQLIREEEERNQKKKDTIAQAEQIALGYDYEGAIALLKSIEGYDRDGALLAKIASMEAKKSTMMAVGMSEVTHIYFQSLIVDTELAFGGHSGTAASFKQWMTTVDEFKAILQSMYNNGYVLVSMHDLVKQKTTEEGVTEFSTNTIYLPAGKVPYILSIDDLTYPHSYEGRGIASRLLLDEKGEITSEYILADGSVVTGAYDCVTILEEFLAEYPDASYKGARGTIGVSGINGILGYRTDEAYKTGENLSDTQKKWLSEHPGFHWEQECADAKAVADALKARGWTFASNTWGLLSVGSASLEKLQEDTEKWMKNVQPLIGKTDIISFPRGGDIGNWRGYSEDNEKYQYLKSQGFDFFTTVDPSQYYLQIRKGHVRQGRRSMDGYRLWSDVHGTKNRTSDLFDATQVLDEKRTDMPGL